MPPPAGFLRFWGIALLIVLSACSDVEEYPFGPGPLETPEKISDASLVFEPSRNRAVLTWTAPRVSDAAAKLIRYEIRFIYDSAFEWKSALSVLNPPPPLLPGYFQEYHFENPEQGGILHAAIVAIDDADKMSPPSNIATLHIPGIKYKVRVINVNTQQPVEGIEMEISGATVSSHVITNASGEFELNDLRVQNITVSLVNHTGDFQFFGLVQETLILEDTTQEFFLIPYRKTDLYPSLSFLSLLKQAVQTQVDPVVVIRKWTRLPVPLYIPEYVNSYGIDYKQTAVDAANCWMEMTGIVLWEFVDEPQPWGAEMLYRSEADMGIHLGYTTHTNTTDKLPLKSDVHIMNAFSNQIGLRRIMLHELGHTIRLRHLPYGYLMYRSHPLPDKPTDDEIQIVRTLNNLPNLTDMSIYREVTP